MSGKMMSEDMFHETQVVLRQQLHIALQQCDVEKVKELIEKDVNVVAPFDNQLTPLFMAIFVSCRTDGEKAARIIELLLQAGAEWNVAVAGGKTLTEFLHLMHLDAQKLVESYGKAIEYFEK